MNTENHWKVFSSGKVRPGYDVDTVCASLQKLFNINEQLASKMVQGRLVLVRKGLPEARARQFLAALTGIGLYAHIVEHVQPGAVGSTGEVAASGLQNIAGTDLQHSVDNSLTVPEKKQEQMQCPACNLQQAIAVACQVCGVVIDEYHAGKNRHEGVPAITVLSPVSVKKSRAFPFPLVATTLLMFALVFMFLYFDSSNYIAVGATPEARAQMAAMEKARNQHFITHKELLALLAAGHFNKVDKLLAGLDASFRADILWERAYSEVMEGFLQKNSYNRLLLDKWVASTGSAYAYLARGVFLADAGWQASNGSVGIEISSARLKQRDGLFALAIRDLEKARTIDAGLLPVYGQLISLSKALHQLDADVLLQQAIAVNPAAYAYRDHYLWALTPRWGGSYDEMQAFIRATRPYTRLNPALYQLGGYIETDKAVAAMSSENFDLCVKHYSEALKHGISARWLRNRAWCLMKAENYDLALADVDLSLAMQDNEDARKIKAYVEYRLR